MNSFFLTVAGFVIAALTLAFAVPHFIDWNSYRHVFEAQASKLVGRNVFVGGDVRLRLLPTPLLRFGEVRIADDKGQIDTPFAQAESFTVWLSVAPLLKGALEAREIEIERPIINVKLTDNGQASWRDMGPAAGDLTFAPSEVALDSVELTDATIVLDRGPRAAAVKLENLTGDLSARSLEGPYKFTGRFSYDGIEREIRFSTGHREQDGGLRLKAVVRDAEGPGNMVLDGTLSNPVAHPSFEGRIVAQYGDRVEASAEAAEPAVPQAPLELQASLAVGLNEARFDDLEVTVRNQGQPQVLRGNLNVAWLGGLGIDGDITSRWVDLNAIVGAGEAPKRLDQMILALFDEAVRQAARVQRGHLHVAIEKASLAGDVVSGIDGQVDLNGRSLAMTGLSLSLPGDNRLTIAGTLDDKGKGTGFAGSFNLEGNELSRLLNWCDVPHDQLAVGEDRGFALDAAIEADGERLVLRDAKGRLFGAEFAGSLRNQWGERPTFSLNLTGDGLDFNRLFGPYATIPSLLSLVRSGGGEKGGDGGDDGPSDRLPWAARANAHVDLHVAAAKLPGLAKATLAAKVSLAGGDLAIERFTLRSAEGLVLHAEGGLAGLDKQPSGRIMLTADAPGPEGIESLWSILDLPAKDLLAERADQMAPMHVAIAIESQQDQKNGMEARLGGAFNKSDIDLLIRYAGDLAKLDEGRFDVEGTLGNSDGAAMMRQLFPSIGQDSLASFRGEPGRIALKADGAATDAFETSARLQVGGFRWRIDGKSSMSSGKVAFEGKSKLQAGDVEPVLLLAGLDLGPRAGTSAVDAGAALEIAGETYRFSNIEGKLGGAGFTGSIDLDASGERPILRAMIEAEEASLAPMLRPLIAWRQRPVVGNARLRARARSEGVAESRWAERGFHMEAISNLKGILNLKAKRLGLAGDLVMSDADLAAVMEGGKIDVTKLNGQWEGGSAAITAKLEQREDGLALTGQARVKGADLTRASALGAGRPLASGRADLDLSLSGIGRTPKGLASSLNGKGALAVSGGDVLGLSPEALRAFAQSEIEAEISRARALPAGATAAFENARFDIEPATIPIRIEEGVVQIDKAVLEGASGQAAVTAYLELATMKLDSEWWLAVKPRDEANEDLQVTVVFAGPAAEFGHLQPRIDTKSLERYVTVNRIARDVERRQQESERIRQQTEAAEEARRAAQQVERPEPGKAAASPPPRPSAASESNEPLPWAAPRTALEPPAAQPSAGSGEPAAGQDGQTQTAEEAVAERARPPASRPRRRSWFEEQGFSIFGD